MSATFSITLSPKAKALLAAATAWPITLKGAIAAALDAQNELTTGHIQRTKLSVRGPQTLGVRTNRLRLSARPTKAIIAGDAILSSIGSNVAYAGVHEFGFKGKVPVAAFVRHQFSNDQVRGQRRGFVARRKGERIQATGFARVRAHTRNVNFPARAMFRTGIEERQAKYAAALSRAIVATFEQTS